MGMPWTIREGIHHNPSKYHKHGEVLPEELFIEAEMYWNSVVQRQSIAQSIQMFRLGIQQALIPQRAISYWQQNNVQTSRLLPHASVGVFQKSDLQFSHIHFFFSGQTEKQWKHFQRGHSVFQAFLFHHWEFNWPIRGHTELYCAECFWGTANEPTNVMLAFGKR